MAASPKVAPPLEPNVPAGLHPELADDVRAEFLRTYQAYRRLAGNHDELKPLSGTGSDFFAQGHPVALTTIESLDTLYLMELDAELREAVEIAASVQFDIDADFQVFETIIRVVGGLLSGYHATQDARLLAQARELTDRIMPAFEESPTGMPYRFVNLHSGQVTGRTNYLAEIGTCITEFGDLSLLTGDPRYVEAAKTALKAVYDRRSAENLVGSEINVETGEWVAASYVGNLPALPAPVVSTINPPVDSFFEYLFEGYYFLGDPDLLEWYNVLTDALLAGQVVEIPTIVADGSTRALVWFSTDEYQTGIQVATLQVELAAFYAGLLAHSGHVELGRAYHESWTAALELGGYRVLPEGLDPLTFEAVFRGNHLRPEYVDAALLLWFATGDALYVDRAAESYANMKLTSRVENGFTVLNDVTTRPETQGDLTSAYWYSENMKYYYLMFGHPARFDYANNYMTTEGNVLRGLLRA